MKALIIISLQTRLIFTVNAKRLINTDGFFDPQKVTLNKDNDDESLIIAIGVNSNTEDKVDEVLDWKDTIGGIQMGYHKDPVLTSTYTILEFLDKYTKDSNVAIKVRPFKSTASRVLNDTTEISYIKTTNCRTIVSDHYNKVKL